MSEVVTIMGQSFDYDDSSADLEDLDLQGSYSITSVSSVISDISPFRRIIPNPKTSVLI